MRLVRNSWGSSIRAKQHIDQTTHSRFKPALGSPLMPVCSQLRIASPQPQT